MTDQDPAAGMQPPTGHASPGHLPISETDDAEFYAVVGRGWHGYYRDRFARVASGRWGGFHFFAAFFGVFWLAYRRMYLRSVVFWLLVPVPRIVIGIFATARLSDQAETVITLGGMAGWAMLMGFRANTWYARFAEKRVSQAHRLGGSHEDVVARLRRAGGPALWAALLLAVFHQMVQAWLSS